MKYLEPIKSFLLFFLVGLSLTLTVMIWNYTPKHQFIEENQSEEVTISPRINIEKTLKPYRVLARTDDTYKGSISTSYSDELYKQFHASLATDLALVSNNISNAQINELMYVNNRLTLFYGTEMPIQVFTKILPFENAELPEMSFNRLIVDWNELKSNKKINIMF